MQITARQMMMSVMEEKKVPRAGEGGGTEGEETECP